MNKFNCHIVLLCFIAIVLLSCNSNSKTGGDADVDVRVDSSSSNMDFTVNGVQFTMIKVEGGVFTMGATSEQGNDAYDDEKPVHKVRVKTFYIGETEVTQELWMTVMGRNWSYTRGGHLPVENVSWKDSKIFIRKLSIMTGKKFRLPTEEEWEYAARGGNKSKNTKYSGSNDVNAVAWYNENSEGKTHNVRSLNPNELGLYDMSGNVWEWTGSYWRPDYNSPINTSRRTIRGGAWDGNSGFSRVSCRLNYPRSHREYAVGFRIAL